jgi:NAD(P)-dependent dehydrogenase (short-subunit alcohol dehydrogenase family)
MTQATGRLDGKHVVVLGGTSGIGFATAAAAAVEGEKVTVASRPDTAS